ncbi:unnamed protein product [Adineta steineri]|uniref:Uncharacterized protein n=1 Tax=Adineta steineri TaxID=433720 RepID=A0A819TBB0_9BILA|nr:unnamed protein product [Adineta steineri]CAF4076926.1 unnamed protein product [Adineta steineri]
MKRWSKETKLAKFMELKKARTDACRKETVVIVSHDTKHAYEECGESGKNFTTTLICRNGINDILLSPYIYTAKDLNPQ